MCYEEAVCCLYSPLNVCLASGDLHKERFSSLHQSMGSFLDCFSTGVISCLSEFSHGVLLFLALLFTYDIVLESLEDQHEDVQAAILESRNFITQELQWHASFIQECDLDPTAETTHHSVTAKYVQFLLATASGNNLDMVHLEIPTPAEKLKIAAHVLSAIRPCVRTSATLGKLIKPASTLQTEELLNRLSNSLTDEEPMKLEVEFFYSCMSVPTKLIPVSLPHNREEERLLLFSVFDFACTTVDSLKGLEQITLSSAKEKSIVGLPPHPGRRPRPGNTHLQMSRADLKKAWDAIAAFDKREMDEWLLKILAIPIAVDFDYDGLCEVLEQLSTGVLKYFNDAIQKYEREHGKPHVTVYIGYSVEDLLCLLKADIGIVFGSDQCIRDVGGWFGVRFVPLFEGAVAKQREFFESGYSSDCEWKGPSGTLYTVSNWLDIHALILGCDLVPDEP
ncbi:hypothetical protein MKW98_017364 [Papaver atlanticum]|uniref:Thiaminase-2/PQQC domain-containing protein n=1 Tax=Papaver atlanticum TaxID=357466 RepID=A0AAD4SSC6_9MAGN|nr:hypothetical protein MKW98_017364 [Papaver atlanticum]